MNLHSWWFLANLLGTRIILQGFFPPPIYNTELFSFFESYLALQKSYVFSEAAYWMFVLWCLYKPSVTVMDFSAPSQQPASKTSKGLEVVAFGNNIGVLPYLRMSWWLLVCLTNFGMRRQQAEGPGCRSSPFTVEEQGGFSFSAGQSRNPEVLRD